MASELQHADLKAINSQETPNDVAPRANPQVAVDGERVSARFAPASWNVIVAQTAPARPA